MKLQHDDSTFSEKLIKALSIQNVALRQIDNKASPQNLKFINSHGAFKESAANQKYIDLSNAHKKNPLGHNHPLYLREPVATLVDYSIHPLTSKALDNFDLASETNFLSSIDKNKNYSIAGFHGEDFQLNHDSQESTHPNAVKISQLINYYQKLAIFSPSGLFNLIKQRLIEFEKKNQSQVMRKGLSLIIKRSDQFKNQSLKYAIISGFNEEDQAQLYFPLALTNNQLDIILERLQQCLNSLLD